MRRREEKKKEDQRREKVRRKKLQVCEKVAKLRSTLFFHPMGAKSRLAKAAGAEPSGEMSDEKLLNVVAWKHTHAEALLEIELSKKCTRLWRKAHLQVKMCKTHHVRNTFGSSAVEKVHAVVARSAFPSRNVEKHTMRGILLDIEMLKKCTTLWREAHFEVKSVRNWRSRTTFSDVLSCGRR